MLGAYLVTSVLAPIHQELYLDFILEFGLLLLAGMSQVLWSSI